MEAIITLKSSEEIESIISKVEKGFFNETVHELENSNIGIYYPAMVNEKDVVIPIPVGYAQRENNFEILITKESSNNGVRVGWHSKQGGLGCIHCSRHGEDPGPDCRHCENHRSSGFVGEVENAILLGVGKLEPVLFEEEAKKYKSVLNHVGTYGLGLYVLHGHSSEHEFTKLPVDVLSVIIEGKTQFLHRSEIPNGSTFIPNMWRVQNGKCIPAGGFMYGIPPAVRDL